MRRLTIASLTVASMLVPVSGAHSSHQESGAPETVIEQGPAGTTSDRDAVFAFSAEIPPEEQGADFACRLTGPQSLREPCRSPHSYEDLPDGEYTFEVLARGFKSGEEDPTPATRTWTVDSSSQSDSYRGTASAGGTVSSDPAGEGASAGDPLTTGVTVPAGGSVSITEQPATTTTEPQGFTVLGREAQITAPDASAAEPLQLVFTLDASAIPPDTDPGEVTVLRDGEPAADCTGSAAADPDPCVSDRRILAGEDLQLTVLSAHASTWSFAVEAPPPPAPAPPPSGDPLGLEGLLRQVLDLLGGLVP